MKVFLTGITGFVGAQVARVLVGANHDVLGLIRRDSSLWRLEGITDKIQFVEGDFYAIDSYQQALVEWKPDACIHLAWYAEPGKYLHSPLNLSALTASLSLLQKLIDIGCGQIVMAGTCAEYDTERGFLTEEGPTKPSTIYAATKLSMALIGQQMANAAGVNFVWGRLFYMYGPYEDERRVIPALIRALLAGRQFPASAGEQVRDYLHVEDVANALILLTEKQVNGIYNIASGRPISIRQLMENIGEITGRSDLIKFGDIAYRVWDPMFICGDNQRLRSLGWRPQYSLKNGLSRTINWLNQRI